MIEIDGGEGGGQVVRTALGLSAVTGRAVRVENVRGGRSTPGLKAQHLAAVRLLAAVADADVEGASMGSETVEFDPGTPEGGHYEAEVGTAGSTALVFDAVLPVATAVDTPLRVTATGGTDVKWAPTVDYYRRVKIPLLAGQGIVAGVDVARRGFYPAGGGRGTFSVAPVEGPLSLVERPEPSGGHVYSVATESLSDADVARRQATAATRALDDAGVEVVETTTTTVTADCPGSAVVVRLDYGDAVAGFTGIGERGTPAEDVAESATEAALNHRDGTAPVDPHMADQLLPILAVNGGRVRIPEVTDHVAASLSVLSSFGLNLRTSDADDGVLVERV